MTTKIWKVEVSNKRGVWSTYLGLAKTAQAAITAAVKRAACEVAPKAGLYASKVTELGDVEFEAKK